MAPLIKNRPEVDGQDDTQLDIQKLSPNTQPICKRRKGRKRRMGIGEETKEKRTHGLPGNHC
jgi:hypothetical protein